MPTDARHGFFLLPVGLEDDEDFAALSAEQRGIWLSILARCYRNWRPWRHGGIELPAYSLICTYASLQQAVGLGPKATRRLRTAVKRLTDNRWIAVESTTNRFTVISLVKAERWQDFDTYRRQTTDRQPTDNRQTIGHETTSHRSSADKGTLLTPTTTPKEQKRGILPLPDGNPMADAVATADHLRQLLLDHDCTTPGIKTAAAYGRRREKWAKALKAAEGDLERSQGQQRALMDWAFSAPSWDAPDGTVLTWADVLACGEPARKWVEKMATIEKQRERAGKPKRARPGEIRSLSLSDQIAMRDAEEMG